MKRLSVSLAASLLLLSASAGAQQPAQPGLADRVKALEQRVADLAQSAAASATASAAVQDLAGKITALEQAVDALGRAQGNHGALVARGDELEARVASAEQQVNALATRLGDLESPTAASAGGAGDEGFAIAGADGRSHLTIGGYVQPRLELLVPEDVDAFERVSFRLRRARLSLQGQLGDRASFKLMSELGGTPALLDAYVDVRVLPNLAVRVGQGKTPFTRTWTTDDAKLDFLERPAGLDNLRYDRDLGVWLRGSFDAGRVTYVVGVANGGGANLPNDNVDLLAAARIERALVGEAFEGPGDVEQSEAPRIRIGAGAVHDLMRLPTEVAGIAVGEDDVDADGERDNVGAISGSVDVAARWRGFQIGFEGYLRYERWGTILEHSANADLAAVVKAGGDGERTYFGGAGTLTWVPADPGCLLVGARVGQSRLSVLGVGGQSLAAPPLTDRLLEVDLTVQLLQRGYRSLGLDYTFADFQARGADPAGDRSHRLILEYQWVL
jgi:hypothetical protein